MILSPVTIEPLQIQIQKYNIEYIVFVLSSIDYMSKRISKLDLDLECSGTVHRKSKKRDQSNKSPGEEKRLHQGQKHKRKNVRMLLKRQRRTGDETGEHIEDTDEGGRDNNTSGRVGQSQRQEEDLKRE